MVGKKEQLISVSKGTQFKKGNKAAVGAKPYSIREQLRWVFCQDLTDSENITESLELLRGRKPPHKGKSPINAGRAFAIRAYERAMAKMDPALFDKIIDQTEGKQSQELIIPSRTEAPTEFMSMEEAAAAYLEHIAK